MSLIIYDFEVYYKDTLFGGIILNDDGTEEVYQTWDLKAIRFFYEKHKEDIFIGHNNWYYDDIIMEAIVNGKDPYAVNNQIIKSKYKPKCKLMPFYTYDLMNSVLKPYSLKLTELLVGKNIHTTDVDFNLKRSLTEEEKKLTEGYNLDDLKQTKYNFEKMYDRFKLRIDMIAEFNLDLQNDLRITGTQIAAKILKAKRVEGIEFMKVKPFIPETLKIENQDIINFYMNERFRIKNDYIMVDIAGGKIKVAGGGAHSGDVYHTGKFLYFDVSGYYNLIMINLGLLPRSMSEEGKKLYEFMYHEQLRLKKINPVKRSMYKTILLSVFGAMNLPSSDFYDPQHFGLVTMFGQLYICDLLEKLKHLIRVIQTNTDGIMVEPLDWANKDEIIKIVEEWEARTGFVIKKEIKYDLWQRDVNCYICRDDKDNIEAKGNLFKNFDISDSSYATCAFFSCVEPPIMAQGVVSYLLYDITPEEFVENHKKDLHLFQYNTRKQGFDYTELETTTYKDEFAFNKKGKPLMEVDEDGNVRQKTTKVVDTCTTQKLQGVDRVFAYNSRVEWNMIYKHKIDNGVHKKSKVSSLPENILVYNYALDDNAYNELKDKIDYDYYVYRIYQHIAEIVEIGE